MNNNIIEINQYNIKAITALNDYLKDHNLRDLLDHIDSYLSQDYGVQRIQLDICGKKLYANFEFDEELKESSFSVKLSKEDTLVVTIFFYDNEQEEINNCLTFIKVLFDIISQTIYNKYLENKLQRVTVTDHLTGLYNRHYIDEYLNSVLPLSSRENKKIAFLKVGIDHFKAVIDEFDYKTGDKVLQSLAKHIKQTVRESDIIARIESDEFLIVLHNIVNEDNAIMVANKVINNFKNAKVVVNEDTNQTLMKTVCTGVSIFPDDADKAEEIFRSSDIALYEARNKGRSQCFKFKKEADSIELF